MTTPRWSSKPREDVLLVGGKERILFWPDLIDVELVKAGVGVGLDGLDVLLDVRTAGNVLAEHVPGDQLAGLLEVLGRGQQLGELARQALVGPQPVDVVQRALGVVAPADLEAALDEL